MLRAVAGYCTFSVSSPQVMAMTVIAGPEFTEALRAIPAPPGAVFECDYSREVI
jgi:hypothetical protein